jgi:glycosyltransferase involved in cell wall biosynthesis
MPRRLLLLLSENPLDPANGAARSVDSICRLLARDGGYDVEALGTTATELADAAAMGKQKITLLSGMGLEVQRQTVNDASILKFERDKVRYTLLDSGSIRLDQPHSIHGPRFDAIYRRTLDRFKPDVVLTFGAMPVEVERHREARRRGIAVVLSIHQHAYYRRGAFKTADAVHTCSEFLRKCYVDRIGIDSVALSGPIMPEDVVAPHHDPVFATFVNPSYEKGVMFMARLAEELATRRPDIPMLVIETRFNAGTLIAAGDAGGFDLRRHESLMAAPAVQSPRDVFASMRLLLAPSLWEEPWGRVAAEALLNGIPPMVSDRGGLAEACSGGGYVFPMPAHIQSEMQSPPEKEVVMPWVEVIEKLCDDESAYAEARRRAIEAAEIHQPQNVLPGFLRFFDSVQCKTK